MSRATWMPEVDRSAPDKAPGPAPYATPARPVARPPPVPGTLAYAQVRGVLELLMRCAEECFAAVEEIMGNSKVVAIVRARKYAIAHLHARGLNKSEIARIVGVDHSSVIKYVRALSEQSAATGIPITDIRLYGTTYRSNMIRQGKKGEKHAHRKTDV